MAKKLVRFDWAMKKMLRHKANFDILEGFLSELLAEEVKIKEVSANVQVKKVISITIAYFDLGQGKDYVYHGTNVFKGIHYGL